MRNFIYHRVFGYVATLTIHVGNLAFLAASLQRSISLHPELKMFSILQPRYLTIWNILFQITYACVSLYTELKTLHGKEASIPKTLSKFRCAFFSAIVVPFAVLVSTLFWPIYTYDRNLVFPTSADIFVSKLSNHIMHTFIVLVPLWELVFQQRDIVTSHTKNCWYIFGMYCIYNSVLFYTKYGDVGIWPYDILDVIEGTIFFPLFFLHIIITLYTSYFLQWPLKESIWSLRDIISVKVA